MPEDSNAEFPSHFLWGASTSGHQVEGGNHNQWTEWEAAHAQELAETAEKRLDWLPNWEDIKKQAQNPDNYISGKGVDHYNLYKEDFALLKKLNLNAFRFCVEWSRIEPEEGRWDQDAINYYRNYILELKKRGIEPVINIWHYTTPVWFAQKGGFLKRRNIAYFERFVEYITEPLLCQCKWVLTINEPNVYASLSYFTGIWPPQHKNVFHFFKVYRNTAHAHRRAYKLIKKHSPELQVGIAAQLGNIQAKHPHNELDEITTWWMRYYWNWWFLRRIRKEQDFVGINYYYTDYYTGLGHRQNPKVPLSDVGTYMEPEGLYPLLLRTWAHYKRPIIVTENGVADARDEYRRWWIEESIVAMERALSEGVQIRGYFHWSLLDNFEWAFGWWPKYGLVAVDREKGMKRTIRPSAKWFAERIEKLTASR